MNTYKSNTRWNNRTNLGVRVEDQDGDIRYCHVVVPWITGHVSDQVCGAGADRHARNRVMYDFHDIFILYKLDKTFWVFFTSSSGVHTQNPP